MSKKFDKFISKSSFDDMVKIKDDNDKVNVFTLEEKDKIKEVVVEVRSDDDFVLLGLKTNLTEDDIAELLND